MADEKDAKAQQDITAAKEKQAQLDKEKVKNLDERIAKVKELLGAEQQTTKQLEEQHKRYMNLGDSMDAQILQQQSLIEVEKSRIKDLERHNFKSL